jgi:dephospho-CoA kinase
MIIIGLTGGIASGKTTVAKMLADLGAVIIDADVVARRVMAKGMPVWERVRETFGKEYMTDNGDIDRKKLGELVFADRKALKNLMPLHILLFVGRYCRKLTGWLQRNAARLL